jgi:hypothetical protein
MTTPKFITNCKCEACLALLAQLKEEDPELYE